MNRFIWILVVYLFATNVSNSQEWFTSLEVAKKLALVQDKMLFMMWEDSFNYSHFVFVNDIKGNSVIIDFTLDDRIDSLIWKYFIPVKVLESEYTKLSDGVKDTRGERYFNKLIDNGIKIMDVNGNILNVNELKENYENITKYIQRYGLNTSFLKPELENYSKDKTTTSAFLLGSKYLDFAILVDKAVRSEIIALANIYFNEAENGLIESNYDNKKAFLQKLELLKIKQFLILNRPKKARRLIKKIDNNTIDIINQSLFSSLNYSIFKLLKNEENARLWKSKTSLVDLKIAEFIININR